MLRKPGRVKARITVKQGKEKLKIGTTQEGLPQLLQTTSLLSLHPGEFSKHILYINPYVTG